MKEERREWREASAHKVTLRNGSTLEVKVFEVGDDDVAVTHTLARSWGGRPLTKTCGWCGDVDLGCIECTDLEYPYLDCVNMVLRCVPKNPPGGGSGGPSSGSFDPGSAPEPLPPTDKRGD